MVVETSAWPMSSCTVRISTPLSRRWVAKECLQSLQSQGKLRIECSRQGDDAVLSAFAIVDLDDAPLLIEVFHPEPENFELAHAGPVGELGDEFPGVVEVLADAVDFVSTQHGWRAATAVAAHDKIQLHLIDAVEVPGEEDKNCY